MRLAEMFPLPARLLTYALLIVTVVLGAGALKDWYLPSTDGPALTTRARQRIVLTPTKEAREAAKATVTTKVVTLKPKPKDLARIEKRYSLDLNTDKLLTEAVVPKSPDGGEVAVTLTPSGETKISYVPSRPKLFEFGGPLEFGGGALLTSGGQGFRLLAAKDLLRVGFIHLRVEGDLDIVNGNTRGAVALLGVYRR